MEQITTPIDGAAVAINYLNQDEPAVLFDAEEMTEEIRPDSLVTIISESGKRTFVNMTNVTQLTILEEDEAKEVRKMYEWHDLKQFKPFTKGFQSPNAKPLDEIV